MESLSNTAKRKKRKTRKCLDDIRKRSRRSGQMIFDKDHSKLRDINSNFNNMNNCLITNNRLTLRMFPKTIRSETITRPALADLKQKQILNLDELVKCSKVLSAFSSAKVRLPELIERFDKNSEHFNNENLKFVSKKCSVEEPYNSEESDNNSHEEKLPGIDQFRSIESPAISDKSPESIGTHSVSTFTTTSYQSLHNDFGYNLYEEFMSEIPTYLKQNASFIQDDVMKKTKMCLQNIFIESCYQECEDNVLKCLKNSTEKKTIFTPSEIIVHNPMDYIRLGHVQQESLFHHSSRRGGTIAGCYSPLHSPVITQRTSSAADSSDSDTPLSVVVHDTPDYTYYPHRLN